MDDARTRTRTTVGVLFSIIYLNFTLFVHDENYNNCFGNVNYQIEYVIKLHFSDIVVATA